MSRRVGYSMRSGPGVIRSPKPDVELHGESCIAERTGEVHTQSFVLGVLDDGVGLDRVRAKSESIIFHVDFADAADDSFDRVGLVARLAEQVDVASRPN